MTHPDLAAVVRERFGTPDQFAAEDRAVIAWRRRVLERALTGAPGRNRPRTRLHRPRLIVRHLEGAPRPWESREALADDLGLTDGWWAA